MTGTECDPFDECVHEQFISLVQEHNMLLGRFERYQFARGLTCAEIERLRSYAEDLAFERDRLSPHLAISNQEEMGQMAQAVDRMLRLAPLSTSYVLRRAGGAPKIARPAGSVIVIVAKWLLNDAAYRDIIDPAIADMRKDVFGALQAGQPRRAKWFVFCGYCRILYPLLAGVLKTVFALLRKSGA